MMAPPVIHPADRLSRLPDEILAHILSFLPAQEAVRTCVLARTWRDVWKFTRRLFITAGKGNSVMKVEEFVDRLLRLRLDGLECASVETCEILFHMHDDYDTQVTVEGWIRRCLECQVQRLRIQVEEEEQETYLLMSDRDLISRHLTRLELRGVLFKGNLILNGCPALEHLELRGVLFQGNINLDGCPGLEHLEINECFFDGVRKIMSPSLKRLVIRRCDSNVALWRFRISAPCLVSLWLEVGRFRAPFLESMPELVEAYVRIDRYWDEDCYHDDPMGCHHVMQAIHISDGGVDGDNGEDYPGPIVRCVLLEGLAQAKDLVLLSHQAMYIFRRDLRMCPTFSNLKTLILNGYWCEPAHCHALACILEHAPVLENLTVIFSEEVELKYGIVMEGHPDATAKSTMKTRCLKTVKIKCHTVHEGVQNVLKFLSTVNICFNLE